MKPNLTVTDHEHSWKIYLTKPDDLAFEIAVPNDVLEWFITARQAATGKEVWSDWIDYYAANGETEIELQAQMARDVEHFIERLLASTIRVVEWQAFDGHRKRLEWRTGEDWRKIEIDWV